jgi:hypothetical protein
MVAWTDYWAFPYAHHAHSDFFLGYAVCYFAAQGGYLAGSFDLGS